MHVRFLGEFGLGDNEEVFCFFGDFGLLNHALILHLVFFGDLGDRGEHSGPSMHVRFFNLAGEEEFSCFLGNFGLGDNDFVFIYGGR